MRAIFFTFVIYRYGASYGSVPLKYNVPVESDNINSRIQEQNNPAPQQQCEPFTILRYSKFL